MTSRTLLMVLLFPLSENAQGAPETFYGEILEHRANVRALALACYQEFPNNFGSLDSVLVRRYLALHDAPKVYDLETLRALGYRAERTIFDRLRRFYGVSARRLPLERRRELLLLIEELNEIETLDKEDYLASIAATDEQRRELELLELAADIVDTRLSLKRRMELDIETGSESPAEYLEQREMHAAADLARWMEHHYMAILANDRDRLESLAIGSVAH